MSVVELPNDLERRLKDFAKATGREAEDVLRQALADWLDDREDLRLAEERIGEPRVSLERLERELGLAD